MGALAPQSTISHPRSRSGLSVGLTTYVERVKHALRVPLPSQTESKAQHVLRFFHACQLSKAPRARLRLSSGLLWGPGREGSTRTLPRYYSRRGVSMSP